MVGTATAHLNCRLERSERSFCKIPRFHLGMTKQDPGNDLNGLNLLNDLNKSNLTEKNQWLN